MDQSSRKRRKIEAAGDRAEGRDYGEQQRREEEAAEDARIDEMVRRNVKRHGG